MGRSCPSVVDFGEGASRKVRRPMSSASLFGWAFVNWRPNLSNGGFHLPYTEDGLYQFDPPRTFSACKVVTMGDTLDGRLSGPNKIVMKLHVISGHASAQLLRRVLVH